MRLLATASPDFSSLVYCVAANVRPGCVTLGRPPRRTARVRLRGPRSQALPGRPLRRLATTSDEKSGLANTVHLRILTWILGRPVRPWMRLRTGKLLIFLFTALGLQRPRLEDTRSSKISSKTHERQFSPEGGRDTKRGNLRLTSAIAFSLRCQRKDQGRRVVGAVVDGVDGSLHVGVLP